MRNRRWWAAAPGVALAVLAAACSSGPGDLPAVPKFTKAATTTTGIDYSAIGLKGVSGRVATTVVLGPGRATVSGVVLGADGVVAGAVVNVERIVDGVAASAIVATAEDGTWSMPAVLGGRYRIRAWRAPDLAQTTATGLFLAATETKSVELRVRNVSGVDLKSSIAPDPPRIDRPSNLVLLVTKKTVGDDGVVRAAPVEGVRIDLIGSSGWSVSSPNPAYTDSSGKAQWNMQCKGTGRQPLAATLGSEQTVPLSINDCVDPAAEETTTTLDEFGNPPTTEEPTTTTTTRRR